MVSFKCVYKSMEEQFKINKLIKDLGLDYRFEKVQGFVHITFVSLDDAIAARELFKEAGINSIPSWRPMNMKA